MTLNSQSPFNCRLRPDAGITLIEILIAMTLLAFVSIAVFQATRRSFEINFKLGAEAQDSTTILLSLAALEADLAQIYSPVVGNVPPKADDKIEAFWSAPVRSDGLRRSRFTGTATKITFVTNNFRRVEADSPVSDFQKVTWEIDRNSNNTYSLYRSGDWDAFHYEEGSAKKPERVALLENLLNGKFTYYRKATKAWEDSWESEGGLVKEETRFPDLIAITVDAPDVTNNAMPAQWKVVVKPNLPLNYLDAKAREAQKQRFLE